MDTTLSWFMRDSHQPLATGNAMVGGYSRVAITTAVMQGTTPTGALIQVRRKINYLLTIHHLLSSLIPCLFVCLMLVCYLAHLLPCLFVCLMLVCYLAHLLPCLFVCLMLVCYLAHLLPCLFVCLMLVCYLAHLLPCLFVCFLVAILLTCFSLACLPAYFPSLQLLFSSCNFQHFEYILFSSRSSKRSLRILVWWFVHQDSDESTHRDRQLSSQVLPSAVRPWRDVCVHQWRLRTGCSIFFAVCWVLQL